MAVLMISRLGAAAAIPALPVELCIIVLQHLRPHHLLGLA